MEIVRSVRSLPPAVKVGSSFRTGGWVGGLADNAMNVSLCGIQL